MTEIYMMQYSEKLFYGDFCIYSDWCIVGPNFQLPWLIKIPAYSGPKSTEPESS